ncbi:MAG: hypothetical protein F4X98_12695 [Gammaproteobacteria bacterium]|nr:hypothetical protein [Gammaproteobacteria bacterium]
MPEPPRFAPKTPTLRTLYEHSGNLRGKPGCSTVLINANGPLVAAVCLIKDAESGGPRFDPKPILEQRRQGGNLMLLCGTCHALVDSEPHRYTVKSVTKYNKQDHEAGFKAVGQTLRQHYLADISDDAGMIDAPVPRSLESYIGLFDEENVSHDLQDADTLRDTITEPADHLSWTDLDDFLKDRPTDLSRLLLDLDFSVFD